jgi:nucleoside-diphosphate-sugar epimerase
MSATVLVTGATGSIGRHLVPALLAAGHAVRGQFVRAAGADARVDWRRWNFLDGHDPAPLVAGCDAVIHLAAAIHDVAAMERLNVTATATLATALERAGGRYFCHASSVVVYGSPPRPLATEDGPIIDPDRPVAEQYRAEPYMLEYARTKALSERALAGLGLDLRIDVVRPAVVVDDAQLLAVLGWSLPRTLLMLHRRTQYVHVEDVAAALVHLAGRGLAGGGTGTERFNIADPAAGTYRDLLRLLARHGRRTGGRERLPGSALSDRLKDLVKHRTLAPSLDLGALEFTTARLADTGFHHPLGFERAAARAAGGAEIG